MKQKTTPMNSFHEIRRAIVLSAVLVGAIATTALATPYATELSNFTGIVYFTVNETNDNVSIIHNGITNVLGPKAAGSYATNVSASGTYSVQVTRNAGAGYKTATSPYVAGKIQISTDPIIARFPTPRGLAVNRNPASPFFGRIYVANSTPASNSVLSRAVGRGLYTLKSDFTDSPNGYGTNAQTAGLPFVVSANSPFRLSSGQDDNVYIGDFADAGSSLTRIDGNLQNGQWVLDYTNGPSTILPPTNHGSIMKVKTTGSLGGGNLKVYTIDEDFATNAPLSQATNKASLWRYDINSGPLTNQTYPTCLGSYLVVGGAEHDFDIGTNGYFYLSQRRDVGGGATPAVIILDPTGVKIKDTTAIWRETSGNPAADDIMTNVNCIAVSPDGQYLACGRRSADSRIWIIPLTNGLPDLGNRVLLDSGAVAQTRGVDFDAAGNVYMVSSGEAMLRAFSPGGFTVTTVGSDGTFNLFLPPTTVSVTVDTNTVYEGSTPAVFTLTRVGDTVPVLTVTYLMSGTATNGTDYTTLSGTVTFKSGDSTTNITFTPLSDGAAETTETGTLALVGSVNYSVGSPSSATVAIVDTTTPAIDVTNSLLPFVVFEQTTNDYARFRVTRRGDTNVALTVNLAYSGSATPDVDYVTIPAIQFDLGQTTSNILIHPIDDSIVETNETIIVSAAAGSGYIVGAGSGPSFIVDDDVPAETVLFSDDFNTTDSSTNWVALFGSTNSTYLDYTATFAYDYSALAIPPAPHTTDASTLGLRMTVNKGGGGAAGLNLYASNSLASALYNFSGNYALRADMFFIAGNGSLTTEYVLLGINHSGTKTNWFRNTAGNVPAGWTFDGLFYGIEADGAALGDYVLYSSPTTAGNNPTALTPGRSASTLTGVFKSPPYNAGAVAGGAPANYLGFATLSPCWVQAEVSQISGVVTLKLNNTAIFSWSITNSYTNGTPMIGYCDAFDSVGPADAQVIYDNVRVVQLDTLKFTSITTNAGNAILDFSWPLNDPPSVFSLQSAADVLGPYVDDLSAVISVVSPGSSYRAVTPVSGSTRFYRLRHL